MARNKKMPEQPSRRNQMPVVGFKRFTALVLTDGGFDATNHYIFGGKPCEVKMSACWPLFLVRQAWHAGCDFEDLADGYGPGMGTHGDWSGIRDSSHEALTAMTERALNFLFPEEM